MIGVNLILFNAFTRTYARVTGFIPMPENEKKKFFTVDKGIFIGAVLFIIGLVLTIMALVGWNSRNFGQLNPQEMMRLTIPAVTFMVTGVQVLFGSFFIGILEIKHK